MDSYYEDLVDYLRHHIPGELTKRSRWFIHDAQGYGNWSDQAGVLDRIIDHIIEGIMEDELLEKELVS